jgi:phage tail-like protein
MSCKVQESSFLILNKVSAWERGLAVNLRISQDGIKIRQAHEYVLAGEIQLDSLARGVEVTDFAVGTCGLIYILDKQTSKIWRYDARQSLIEPIRSLVEPNSTPVSIIYAPGKFFVAYRSEGHRILSLAEANWQIRWAVGATPQSADETLALDKPFQPSDLAVDRDGNLYALDQGNLSIVKFDAGGRLVGVFGAERLKTSEPSAVALSPDGFLYVLDRGGARVLKLNAGGGPDPDEQDFKLDFTQVRELPADFMPAGFAVDASGILYVGDGRQDMGGREENRFVHRFSPSGQYLGAIKQFRGAAERLAVGADDWIYIFNRDTAQSVQKLVILKPELKYSHLDKTSLVKGRYFSISLDSTEAGTRWHKFLLAAETPANTQIYISYLVADEKRLVTRTGQVIADLDKLLSEAKGKAQATGEVERATLDTLDALEWSEPLVNTKDALIRAGTGRYLWLRADLIGSESLSPEISNLRVDFPRTSYLHYLPAIYQEEESSRDFLERFLALYETFFSGLERQIEQVARYFDAEAVVARDEFLRWLASWLALAVDKSWDEERLRALVKRAPDLFKKRGTRAGLEELIELFTGERPLIFEHFQSECATDAELKALLARLYGTDPYCFCVLLKPFPLKSDEQRQAVRRILDREKPAHTCAGLQVLQPWIYLDMHTYLGVNTYLSQPSARLDLGSAIPRDTVLSDVEETGQLERHSRIDVDTVLI